MKQRLGDKAGAALIQQQRALVRQLLATFPGAEEIETAGDSFLLSFPKPSDAVTGQEMLVFKEAEPVSLISSVLTGKFLVWREREGPIRVTALPTLAEIDAAEKRTAEKTQ